MPADAQKTAASTPTPAVGDPRIRDVLYDENQIVQIRGRLGYEMTIEFDPEERIENVSIGDSLSWQVTPNRKATLLFLKPMSKGNPTSMTVATSKRIYSFQLTAYEARGLNDPDAVFRLRFLYPAPPELPAPPPAPPSPPPRQEDFNFAYAYKGEKKIYPVRVFDDGVSTFFEFSTGKETPAVFVIGPDGKEEMANTRIQGRYSVADIVAKTFVLRYGKARAEINNSGWREPATSTQSSPPPIDQLPAKGGQP
jgi:type IV secretion system protein VirB9